MPVRRPASLAHSDAAAPLPQRDATRTPLTTDDARNWFDFVMSDGSRRSDPELAMAGGFADLSRLDPEPAGAHGALRAVNGHIVDGRGERVRLLGTNLTADACFPNANVAPRIAALFRRLGLNAVRLHAFDSGTTPSGLLAADNRSLDSAQLDRFDRLIAELEHAGLYVVLSLHANRRYPDLDGAAAERFPAGKLLDRFHLPFIDAERDFARKLLTHVNPYTARSYADDPAVAWLELSSQDSLLPFWGGDARTVPEPYASELAAAWHRWLMAHYASVDALVASWRAGHFGPELIADAAFDSTDKWRAEQVVPTRLEVVSDGDRRRLRFQADRAGTQQWHLQFSQSGVALHPGRTYALAFDARSSTSSKLQLSVILDVADWHNVGVYSEIPLGTDWSPHRYTFVAHDLSPTHGRLNFSLANQPGSVEISNLTLREVIASGDPAAQPGGSSLSEIVVPGATAPAAARDDWHHFLADTEIDSARSLVRTLRDELHVHSMIVNTQANLGGIAGIVREASVSDSIDLQGYWDQPITIGGTHGGSWSIKNTSQVRALDGGVLGAIAAHRVVGRPFSVSEYNTAAPNDAAAETLPLLTAIAAFQDWDAIFTYAFADFSRDYDSTRIRGFFDLAGDPGRLVFSPAAALVFRRGLVEPARAALTLSLAPAPPSDAPSDNALPGVWAQAGVAMNAVTVHRLEVRLPKTAEPAQGLPALSPVLAGSPSESDTGQIAWNPSERFTINAPAVRLAVGALAGQRVSLGDVELQFGRFTSRTACVELVALDELPITDSRAVLMAVAARVENTGMEWNARRTSVGDRWGTGPLKAEFVPLTVSLPGEDWRGFALDATGAKHGRIAVEPVNGKTQVKLGGHRSLWYLLTRSGKPAQ